jgi:hypothetical protein
MPRWRRLSGLGREELEYVLRRFGVIPPQVDEPKLRVDAEVAVIALALLLTNPPAQIRSMRSLLAAHSRRSPALVARLRDEAGDEAGTG